MTDYDASTIERFWAKVDRRGPDDCWEWTARRSHSGYGNFKVGRLGKKQIHRQAHAVAYEIEFGPIPSGHFGCHRCDNPPCCNPRHIYAGTPTDNMKDMIARNRQNFRGKPQCGQENGNAKLDASAVIEIRGLITGGLNNKQIARRYGVTHQTISNIRLGRNWKHLHGLVAQLGEHWSCKPEVRGQHPTSPPS